MTDTTSRKAQGGHMAPAEAELKTAKLSLRGVSKTFQTKRGEVNALASTDLDVTEGEFVTIVGPSGCGKSTLLMIGSGLEPPSSGEVLVDGASAGPPGPDRSVVFQQFALFPNMTVAQNIGFGLKTRGLSKEARKDPVRALIDQMSLQGFESAYPSELSGGMQQRVAIARSEEHTSELQSRFDLVCRLLLEKKTADR